MTKLHQNLITTSSVKAFFPLGFYHHCKQSQIINNSDIVTNIVVPYRKGSKEVLLFSKYDLIFNYSLFNYGFSHGRIYFLSPQCSVLYKQQVALSLYSLFLIKTLSVDCSLVSTFFYFSLGER